MRAVFLKEINAFFSNAIGYLVIAVFLILCGLFLWVFEGQFNIPNYGFANLSGFFQLAPWVLLFLIPAITMRSFSEEYKQGTIELLLTRPLSPNKLIIGKFLGSLFVAILAIIPTLLYVIAIYALKQNNAIIDTGQLIGSYIGLFLLTSSFTAIGVFCSTLSKNQIIAFVVGALISFLCYYAFEGLSTNLLHSDIYTLDYLGMSFHYQSISRGVLDTRDVIYFLSIILLFLGLTRFNLKRYKR